MSLSLYLFFPKIIPFFHSVEFFCVYLCSPLTPFGSAGCFLLPRFSLAVAGGGSVVGVGGQTLFVVASVVRELYLLGEGLE